MYTYHSKNISRAAARLTTRLVHERDLHVNPDFYASKFAPHEIQYMKDAVQRALYRKEGTRLCNCCHAWYHPKEFRYRGGHPICIHCFEELCNSAY